MYSHRTVAGSVLLSRQRFSSAAVAAVLLVCGGEACAQAVPDNENGRFTMSPVAEGFLRLDTRTGAVSTCSNKGGWTCRAIPDERAALDTEIGRLQADNKKLKEQLAQRETAAGKTGGPAAPDNPDKNASAAPDKPPSADKKIELQLPPEHEKLLALLDRVWDRLIEMAVRLQKRLSEKAERRNDYMSAPAP